MTSSTFTPTTWRVGQRLVLGAVSILAAAYLLLHRPLPGDSSPDISFASGIWLAAIVVWIVLAAGVGCLWWAWARYPAARTRFRLAVVSGCTAGLAALGSVVTGIL